MSNFSYQKHTVSFDIFIRVSEEEALLAEENLFDDSKVKGHPEFIKKTRKIAEESGILEALCDTSSFIIYDEFTKYLEEQVEESPFVEISDVSVESSVILSL